MRYFSKIIFLLFIVKSTFLFSQQDFPKGYFAPPVDFGMALSGTFGELRSNHFHSGIDIKTWGVQGKPLFAIADGFVSRIAVSPGGYGNAVYIEHPNGFTSVFGHCLKFSRELADYVKKNQYLQESFQVNLFPDKDQFKVKKGDIIAYSGNSGGSMGPHLHFELRRTEGQIPVNPLLFGFDIKDFVRPKIEKLRIYPFGNYSFIQGKNKHYDPELSGWGPDYHLKSGDTLSLSGKFYFGINAYDQLNDSKNQNGIFSIQLYIDTTLVYCHKMDDFSFSENKYVNALIDYSAYANEKTRFQKTYIEPGNLLSVYDVALDNGVYNFVDDDVHHLSYVVKDAYENKSVLSFYVKSTPPVFKDFISKYSTSNPGYIFNWDQDNNFSVEKFKLLVPKGALYDTLNFAFSSVGQKAGYLSPVYKVHHPDKAIHTYCELSIQPAGIADELKDKALVVKLGKGDGMISAGGSWDGDWLTTKIYEFGDYTVVLDTVPPKISPVNISAGKNISQQSTIKIKITDELSGIADYRATMNGKWLLMEWDPKNSMLTYFVDEHTNPGKNNFRLEVKDGRGNLAIYEALLVR